MQFLIQFTSADFSDSLLVMGPDEDIPSMKHTDFVGEEESERWVGKGLSSQKQSCLFLSFSMSGKIKIEVAH